jgi:hypothetical protein
VLRSASLQATSPTVWLTVKLNDRKQIRLRKQIGVRVKQIGVRPAILRLWTHAANHGDPIYVEDVRELRTALNEALAVLHLETPPFTDPTLIGAHEDAAQATPVRESRSGSGLRFCDYGRMPPIMAIRSTWKTCASCALNSMKP